MSDEVAVLERERLNDLRYHWGSAYYITNPGDDTWVAFGRSSRSRNVLVAGSAAELRHKIRADYR